MVYDVVIALGKNWEKYPRKEDTRDSFNLRLSLESRMTAIAVLRLLQQGETKEVIISTGKTAGRDWPSESRVMFDYIKKRNGFLAERIFLEENSFDTAGNVEECKKKIGRNYENIAVLTMKAHLPRAVSLFRNYGLEVSGIASENILGSYRGREETGITYKRFLERYEISCRNFCENAKEKALHSLVSGIDSKGRKLRKITRILRHQSF